MAGFAPLALHSGSAEPLGFVDLDDVVVAMVISEFALIRMVAPTDLPSLSVADAAGESGWSSRHSCSPLVSRRE